jgi:hypothetical protein
VPRRNIAEQRKRTATVIGHCRIRCRQGTQDNNGWYVELFNVGDQRFPPLLELLKVHQRVAEAYIDDSLASGPQIKSYGASHLAGRFAGLFGREGLPGASQMRSQIHGQTVVEFEVAQLQDEYIRLNLSALGDQTPAVRQSKVGESMHLDFSASGSEALAYEYRESVPFSAGVTRNLATPGKKNPDHPITSRSVHFVSHFTVELRST